MREKEVISLINECKALYSTYKLMYEDEKIIEEWIEKLSKYERADIYASLERHKDGNYSTKPIVLADLIRNVPTIVEKESKKLGNIKVYCKICCRLLPYEESIEHEDRCRSINYMETQYKRFSHKRIDKEKLYNMSQEEFDLRYKAILEHVYNNTTNESEKKVISKILYDTPLNLKDVGMY